MNSLFYPKLALSNIKNNVKLFFPYILMNVGIIAMYFIMHSLSVDPGIKNMSGGSSLQQLLSFGTVVIAIFSAIFIFYTNSFLSKRRKKEIGLYNILGMGKRHLSKMLFIETLFIALICLTLGLITGIVLNKLMVLILLKLVKVTVTLKFVLSIKSILATILLFSVIFLVTLIFNLGSIHLTNPIELLKGGQTGEKEPKTKWLMTLIGIITLGAGYYIAQVVESPLAALGWFFIAVILVMIGTYCLFTAGSIALLKLLKKNKKLYYKANHFNSISGMIYRMKQNAVGLANICILSTAVLVTLSTTLSLYVGLEDLLKTQYPMDIKITNFEATPDSISAVEQIIDQTVAEFPVTIDGKMSYHSIGFPVMKTDTGFEPTDEISGWSNLNFVTLLTLDDYNIAYNDSIELDDDEILFLTSDSSYKDSTVHLGSETLTIKKQLSALFDYTGKEDAQMQIGSLVIVVNSMDRLQTLYDTFYSDADEEATDKIQHFTIFDVKGEESDVIAFNDTLYQNLNDKTSNNSISSIFAAKNDFLSLYGGLFFIGIFLGTLFLMATVMIIYYKQVSEGYDDKSRFEIMQKVGMSSKEIKHTIRTQILMVFFLPLIFAVIHISFAFHVITKLIALFGFTNIPLFFLCMVATIIVFALIYLVVYLLTARVYYKIVK